MSKAIAGRPNPFPSIFIDFQGTDERPTAGDYVVTLGKRGMGTAYFIRAVRKVKSRRRVDPSRYILSCERQTVSDIPAGAQVWTMRWYLRLKKRKVAQ